jgi:hypothetical protein
MDTDRGYHVHYPPVLTDIGSYAKWRLNSVKIYGKISSSHFMLYAGKYAKIRYKNSYLVPNENFCRKMT